MNKTRHKQWAEEAHSIIQECFKIWNTNLVYKLKWSPRLVQTTGSAHYRPISLQHRIVFSEYWWTQFDYNLRREIIIHEIAHLVAYQIKLNSKPHSNIWCQLMLAMNLTPRVRIDLLGLAKTPPPGYVFVYCDVCDVNIILSKIRTKRMLEGTKRYVCAKCGSQLLIRNIKDK